MHNEELKAIARLHLMGEDTRKDKYVAVSGGEDIVGALRYDRRRV